MFDFLKGKKNKKPDLHLVEDTVDETVAGEAEEKFKEAEEAFDAVGETAETDATQPAEDVDALAADEEDVEAEESDVQLENDEGDSDDEDIEDDEDSDGEDIEDDEEPDEDFEEEEIDEDSFEEDEVDEESFEEGDLPPQRKDPAGYFMEMAREEEEGKKRSVGKTILKVLLGIIGFAALAYLAVSAFFIGHFYYDTTINGVDFSLKSADDVEKYMSRQVDDYVLTVNELQGDTETIVGADIGIRYKQSTQIKQQLKAQNPLLWIRAFWEPDSMNVDVGVDYEEEKLAAVISKLQCMDESKWTKSSNAKPEFDGSQFVVAKEVYGTTINKDIFNKAVRDAISQFVPELSLEEAGCYQPPKFVSTSPEVQAACDKMNNYSKACVTYTFGDTTEVVDRNVIKDWLKVNTDNMKVTYNEDKVTDYLKALGKKYDTIGKTRTITSPAGEKYKVSGGTYGWEIDEAKEAKALKKHIKKGETVTKEPAYVQRAASRGDVDWGSTYAEVDISKQHAWYIKDGKVAFEFDVVTGLPTAKRATPTGVHQCLEKARNKVLRGDRLPSGKYEYETPVAYWMRVTWSGVGFHTATWQPSFGGNRYTYAGSHGCINMSYNDSVTLYGLIEVGDAVIIHK